MKLRELESYLVRQQSSFFQFAMVLSADEDVSEKLILDSEYLLLSEEKEDLGILMNETSSPAVFFRYSKKFILSSIFKISRKNNLFQAPRNGKIDDNAFWSLPMEQRAVLCLRQTLRLNKDEITEILNLTNAEYFNLLNLARESLLKKSGSMNGDIRETY